MVIRDKYLILITGFSEQLFCYSEAVVGIAITFMVIVNVKRTCLRVHSAREREEYSRSRSSLRQDIALLLLRINRLDVIGKSLSSL